MLHLLCAAWGVQGVDPQEWGGLTCMWQSHWGHPQTRLFLNLRGMKRREENSAKCLEMRREEVEGVRERVRTVGRGEWDRTRRPNASEGIASLSLRLLLCEMGVTY